MTDLLKDMMNERADALGAPELDMLAMVREGNRRATRRSLAVISGIAAASVVAAIAVPNLLHEDSQRGEEFSFAGAFESGEPSYAVGSRVTVDSHTFDTGHQVHAIVQTTEGVVFVDQEGAVFASSGGEAEQIGQTDLPPDSFAFLESDGSLAAWIAHPDGQAPVFTAYDQATGEIYTSDYVVRGGPSEYSPALWAVDGGNVWLRDDRGAVRWTVATGEQSWLGASQGLEIYDVSAGVVAHTITSLDGASAVRFGDGHLGDVETSLSHVVDLSPTGTTALGYADPGTQLALADTKTGEVSLFETPDGYGVLLGYRWVDSDTFVALGLDKPGSTRAADLLTCEVGGGCRVTAEAVGTIQVPGDPRQPTTAGLAVPNGGLIAAWLSSPSERAERAERAEVSSD